MDAVGKDGAISVEESQTFGIDMDIVEGMQYERGYISPYMATDMEKMEPSSAIPTSSSPTRRSPTSRTWCPCWRRS